MLNKDFTLENFDLQYVMNVTYITSYPQGACTCTEDDFCRCTVIEEEDVAINANPMNSQLLFDLFIENKIKYEREQKLSEMFDGVDINLYSIGRIISINKLYDKDSYEINISSGYYGEELDSVKLKKK